MTFSQAQLNKHCEAYQNVDGVTLHTDFPGNTAANDSGITKATLGTWPDAVTGLMTNYATFASVPAGEYPYAVTWDGTAWVEVIEINLVTTQTIPLTVQLDHYAKVRV